MVACICHLIFFLPQHIIFFKKYCVVRHVRNTIFFGRPFVKRFALCYRSVVCLSDLSVHVCDVRALWPNGWSGRIKIKLGMQVGRGPGHIELGRDPAPPPLKGHSHPQFSVHFCCGQMAAWIKMSLGMEVGLGPGHFVLDGDPVLFPQKGSEPRPQFSAHFYCAKRLHASKYHLVRR